MLFNFNAGARKKAQLIAEAAQEEKRKQTLCYGIDASDVATEYGLSDIDAFNESFMEAVIACDSIDNQMVRCAKVQMLFAESKTFDSDASYYAESLFDSVKGFAINMWTVITDAIKAVGKWVYNVFKKYMSSTGKNMVNFDATFRQLVTKLGEIGEYGVGWKLPEDFKIPFKLTATPGITASLGLRLWDKNAFNNIKIAGETAENVFKNLIGKSVAKWADDIVSKVKSSDGNTVLSIPMIDEGNKINTIRTALSADGSTGIDEDGPKRRSKQVKYIINQLLYADADNKLLESTAKGRQTTGVQMVSDTDMLNIYKSLTEDWKLVYDAFINGKVTDVNTIIRNAIKAVDASVPSVSKVPSSGELVTKYITTAVYDKVGKICHNLSPEIVDVRNHLVVELFKKPQSVDINTTNAGEMVSNIMIDSVVLDSVLTQRGIPNIKADLDKGSKFFDEVSKEYVDISAKLSQLKDTIKEHGTNAKSHAFDEMSNGLTDLLKNVGTITSWYTTAIIQTYAVSDMMVNNGIISAEKSASTLLDILNKSALKNVTEV